VDFSKLAEEALKRALDGLKEADKLAQAQTSDWDGACKQMLYAHAALRFCEGGKAEMDGVETLLKALQTKLPEEERGKLAALVRDGSASQPIWETVGHTAPRTDRLEWKKVLADLPSVEERERDGALDDRILRGHEIVVANLEQLKRVVRLLVSSTFTVSSPCVYAYALRVVLRCPPSALTEALLAARLRAAALRPPCLGPTHGTPARSCPPSALSEALLRARLRAAALRPPCLRPYSRHACAQLPSVRPD
jgi:hypothetical protein